MDNFKNEMSFPRSGMHKGTDPRNMKENEYTHALNTNLNSVDGDYIDVSFEKSNVLSVKFPEGYVVIGKFNRLINNYTYYFMHNPYTKKNKFGYVDNNFIFKDKEDLIQEEGSQLSEKLEEVIQEPFKQFIELLNDECVEEGFNFKEGFPIKNPLLKEEKTGGVVYFTDGINPPRFIKLDKIQEYYTRETPCDKDVLIECPDFEKMRIHKRYKLPEIDSVAVSNGGSLKKGSYVFIVALTDSLGSEVSEYFSATQPTDIWENGEGDLTNKAIRISLRNLDTKYTNFKLVAVVTEKDSRTTGFYEVGVFPTNQTEVVVSDLRYASRTSIEKISFINQRVLTAEGLTSANNSLMEYGIVFERELNLQPVVNLLGAYLEWQTHESKENLYEYGDARTKYLGIARNEVVPYGIRFLKKGGSTTAIFPLVGREATSFEKTLVSVTDKNRKSFEVSDTCSSSERSERWQYHNTSEVIETISKKENIEVEYEKVDSCQIKEVKVLPSGKISIDLEDPSESLQEYVDRNKCTPALQELGICNALEDKYTEVECVFDNEKESCIRGEDIERKAYITEVKNEEISYTYETSFDQYVTQKNTTQYYNPFILNGGEYVKNTQAVNYDLYERADNPETNNSKVGARDVSVVAYAFQSNFKIFKCDEREQLSTSGFKSPNNFDSGRFNLNINDNSQWFFADLKEGGKFITITKAEMATMTEPFPVENFTFSPVQRVSFFREGSNNAIYSILIDQNINESVLLYKEGKVLNIKTNNSSFNIQNYEQDKIYFVIEQGVTVFEEDKCIKHATKGGYQVYSEDLQVKGKQITFDSIIIGVDIMYKIKCSDFEPTASSCTAVPFQRGKFSYWESELTYPDNRELYDSTQIRIKAEKLPQKYRQDFIQKFTKGVNFDGTLKIKPSYNLTCQPIRHFKFPDNSVSPFMTNQEVIAHGETLIYPLGVTLNEEIINMFLDIAKDSKLITKEERDSIYSYEIFRGNLTTSRSVVASGLVYDFRKYTEGGKEVMYSNYPYNSFGKDYLNKIEPHSKLGLEGSEFTFHSPETDYTSNIQASEMKIEGYQFGYSRGNFNEVEGHPKWTILTPKAESTASTLATVEIAADAAITVATLSAQVPGIWVVGGLGSTGTNAGGYFSQIALAILAGGIVALEGVLYRYAQLKQQWMDIIEGLGVSNNFAYYYYSVGEYNYMKSLKTEENSVRAIQGFKYIKDGRLNITNRVTKKRYDINNIDREWSTFLTVGEEVIKYPIEYTNYDKESILYQGKKNIVTSGRSAEIIENISSMYAQLINYNSSLHGNIDSLNWITTSYKGDLEKPKTTCLPIFGGDTYISRHSLKRKIPLFLNTAMGQSSTTPWEYKSYNNIGRNPLFYINYKVESEYSRSGKSLPIIKSELVTDNESGKKFYYISPSKIYLYYYGVPSFLTETRINTNFREYGRTDQQNFYPNVGDIGRWTQESNVKLREPNYFKYDFTFTNQTIPFNYRTLPSNFKREGQDVVENAFNGVMFSLPDYNENGQNDSWLKFRPLDFYEFDSRYGKVKELKGIENEAILARFEHTAIVFNKVTSTIDDGSSPSTYLGGKDMFNRRTVSFVNSELGYGGTQHSESLSCEYGHFYADNKRGQIMQIPSGGGNMVEISTVNSYGAPTNMREWFKRHLPYKLLDSNIKGIEKLSVDNAYNYIGMSFGYDPLHKRILITKKDYIPVAECPLYYTPEEGFYTDGCVEPISKCPEGFEKVVEVISCGLRLALIIDNKTESMAMSSITLFKQVVEHLKGSVEIAIYNSNGEELIVGEDLNTTEALNRLNSYVPSANTSQRLTEVTCKAGEWLNKDLSKNRILHGVALSWKSPVPDDEVCGNTNTIGVINTAEYLKNSGVTMIGSGDSSFLINSGYFSDNLSFLSLQFSDAIKKEYDSVECEGEDYTIETCKKTKVTSLCPSGYVYDNVTNSCRPINNKPLKEEYSSLDIVFYLSYFPEKEEYERRKTAIITALNSFSTNPKYLNNRYALVADEFKKGSSSKYRNVVPFTNDIQDIKVGLSTLVWAWEYFNIYYSPTDLVFESIAKNYVERSYQDNSFVSGSKSLGDFRDNVGKVVYWIGRYFEGSGLKMEYDSKGQPNYSFKFSQQSKEGYDYYQSVMALYKQKNIQTFAFNSEEFADDEVAPSPENEYHLTPYTSKYYMATTPCFHYYVSNRSNAYSSLIVKSIDNIGYKECEAKNIPIECDCTVVGSVCECYEYADEQLIENKEKVSLDDDKFFKEISWTVAYYPEYGQFSSFYSYFPNYYVNHFKTFETGRKDLTSLWSHNSTNKSFGVFYGKFNPMEIEVVVKANMGNYLGSVGLLTETKRYFNNADYYITTDLTFNKSIIYNRKECSGILHLDYIKGHTRYLSKYPINISETEQRIPITKSESFYNYNYFFNRVNKTNNRPFLRNDDNEIGITIENTTFKQGRNLGRLNGDYFLNRLTYDKDSRFCLTMKLQKSLTNLDNM